MSSSYVGQDGNIYVWTGTGYQMVPGTIAAGDTGVYRTQDKIWSQGDNPYLIQDERDLYGITNYDPYGMGDLGYQTNNWQLDSQRNSPDAFSYLLKSGDKEGGRINYTRQDDGSFRGSLDGFERMDTSANDGMALAVLAAPFAVAGAQGAGLLSGAGAETGTGLAALGEGPVAALSSAPTIAEPGMFAGMGLDGLGSSVGNFLTDPKNLSSLMKVGGLLAGGLAGGAGSGDNTTSSGPRSIPPSTIPQMYGQGSNGGLLGGSWGALGPTQTERMMRGQYMPSLLGQGPWGL